MADIIYPNTYILALSEQKLQVFVDEYKVKGEVYMKSNNNPKKGDDRVEFFKSLFSENMEKVAIHNMLCFFPRTKRVSCIQSANFMFLNKFSADKMIDVALRCHYFQPRVDVVSEYCYMIM